MRDQADNKVMLKPPNLARWPGAGSNDYNAEWCERRRSPSCPGSPECDLLDRSDRRLDLELGGQLADLRGRITPVATKGLRNGSLPSLAQRDTVLGDTCKMAAASAARK
jgi:hypothetical protein